MDLMEVPRTKVSGQAAMAEKLADFISVNGKKKLNQLGGRDELASLCVANELPFSGTKSRAQIDRLMESRNLDQLVKGRRQCVRKPRYLMKERNYERC